MDSQAMKSSSILLTITFVVAVANPDDDPSKGVFTPELRGKTDRFIMRFRKAD